MDRVIGWKKLLLAGTVLANKLWWPALFLPIISFIADRGGDYLWTNVSDWLENLVVDTITPFIYLLLLHSEEVILANGAIDYLSLYFLANLAADSGKVVQIIVSDGHSILAGIENKVNLSSKLDENITFLWRRNAP